MQKIFSARTAATVLALSARPRGLRLAEIARLLQAPLSSVQRTIQSLEEDGVVIRLADQRPVYRLAPGVPVRAMEDLAAWALPPREAAAIRQRAALTSEDLVVDDPALETITKQTLKDRTKGPRLRELAQQVIWWEPPKGTLKEPARVIAQAMAAGTLEDAAFVEDLYGTDILRNVLADAPPGVFGPQAWSYWHHRLGYRRVPPQPTRVLT
jgi:predicted DNA-binding transcriptional regulator YafY